MTTVALAPGHRRQARRDDRKGADPQHNIASVIAQLQVGTVSDLRKLWREQFRTDPPPTFTARLMRLALAWHLQSIGGGAPRSSDISLARALDRVAGRRALGAKPQEAVSGLKPPPVPIGTRLMKTWGNETHEVIVLAEGVLWRGKTWSSLSAVARAITGCARNGPGFFGLRAASR